MKPLNNDGGVYVKWLKNWLNLIKLLIKPKLEFVALVDLLKSLFISITDRSPYPLSEVRDHSPPTMVESGHETRGIGDDEIEFAV